MKQFTKISGQEQRNVEDQCGPVMDFLRDHHVSRRRAAMFCYDAGTLTLNDLKLFMRLYLPPLAFSWSEKICLRDHIADLLGLHWWWADKFIKDLDLDRARFIFEHHRACRLFVPGKAQSAPSAPFMKPHASTDTIARNTQACTINITMRAEVLPLDTAKERDATTGSVLAPLAASGVAYSLRGKSGIVNLQPCVDPSQPPEDTFDDDFAAMDSTYRPGSPRHRVKSDFESASAEIRRQQSAKKQHGSAKPERSATAGDEVSVPITPSQKTKSVTYNAGRSGALGTGMLPQKARGTTASRTVDRGAYHQANALLRTRMAHFSVNVHERMDTALIFVAILSFIALGGYVGIRAAYLAMGFASRASNVSAAYSWVVLAAEVAIAALGFYCRMLTRRQDPEFVGLTDDQTSAMVQVHAAALSVLFAKLAL